MFKRSEHNRDGVRYTRFVADGDSKNYRSIVDNNPYPGVEIVKYECIGHVGKRMGARLRKLRKENNLGGRGGLSDPFIKRVQSYYSNAIRTFHSNINEMRDAIWAIYYHYLSSDEDPQHFLCPFENDTWCDYNRAANDDQLEGFSHNVKVEPEKWEKSHSIFVDLTNQALLERCANGYRQNVNESFNSLIWLRLPKTTYRSIDSIKLGLFDAVICSNEKYSGRLKVLDELEITYSEKTVKGCERLDQLQAKHSASDRRNVGDDVFDEEDVCDDDYLYEGGMHE